MAGGHGMVWHFWFMASARGIQVQAVAIELKVNVYQFYMYIPN